MGVKQPVSTHPQPNRFRHTLVIHELVIHGAEVGGAVLVAGRVQRGVEGPHRLLICRVRGGVK